MASKYTSQPASSAAVTQLIYFLRLIQQGALVLAGFVAIYFTYWHIFLADPIPIPLPIFAATALITYLESYISTAHTLSSSTHSVEPTLLLRTSAPCSVLMIVGYAALRTTPFLRKWCEGDNWFKPTRVSNGYKLEPAGVEEHQCALACVVFVAGAVALFASLCVSTIAAWGAWRGRGNACGKGYKAVGEGLDEDEEDDNEAICGIDDVEKP